MRHKIIICGGNGAGKSTLGKELSDKTGWVFRDIEDYYFPKTDPDYPYAVQRTEEEVVSLLYEELKKDDNFIFASVRGNHSEKTAAMFTCAVFVSVPKEIRMKRVRQRSFGKFGDRISEGGDLYEREKAFYDIIEKRTDKTITDWLETIDIPVIRVDGTKAVEESVEIILSKLNEVINMSNNTIANHYDILIEENNDPVHDAEPLKAYMDKWDGLDFINKMELNAEKSVLEIGVGTGRLAVRVAPLCKEFYGIDISPKTIDRAKENLSSFENVKLICEDILRYSFNIQFDVIYSSLTFMHISEKQKALNLIAGLLAPNGKFVLSIDKNQDEFIDIGSNKIKVYPDKPSDIKAYISAAGLKLTEQYETEFAHIFVCRK